MKLNDYKQKKFSIRSMNQILENEIGLFLLLVLFVVSAIIAPGFLRVRNIQNILLSCSLFGFLAIGSGLVLLSGNIDLSPGAVVAFCSVITAYFTQFSITIAIAVGIFSSLLIGSISGVLTAKAKIPSLLATLGMMGIARSGALYFSSGQSVSTSNMGLTNFVNARFFGLPIPFIAFFISIIVMSFVMKFTRLGRRIYAIGGNEESAFFSGIKTSRIKIQLFVLASMFYGLGGLVYTGRINSGNPEGGMGYELDAITIAVLGGIALDGGKGKIRNVLVGALILAIIANFMNLRGISVYYQHITKGFLFLAFLNFRILISSKLLKAQENYEKGA